MSAHNNYTLWENDEFVIRTPFNPHIPYSEGLHLVLAPKKEYQAAWDNPELAGRAFELASKVSAILVKNKFAPWINLQANGNWGLLPGSTPFFHIHIYGRNKTDSWGRPLILPELPETYNNDPMPESDRNNVEKALKQLS